MWSCGRGVYCSQSSLSQLTTTTASLICKMRWWLSFDTCSFFKLIRAYSLSSSIVSWFAHPCFRVFEHLVISLSSGESYFKRRIVFINCSSMIRHGRSRQIHWVRVVNRFILRLVEFKLADDSIWVIQFELLQSIQPSCEQCFEFDQPMNQRTITLIYHHRTTSSMIVNVSFAWCISKRTKWVQLFHPYWIQVQL